MKLNQEWCQQSKIFGKEISNFLSGLSEIFEDRIVAVRITVKWGGFSGILPYF